MIVYYILMGLLGVFVIVFLVVGGVGLVQNRRMPIEKKVELIRKQLFDNETDTGSTHYAVGTASRVSDEMIIGIAESEGFKLVDNGHYRITFQRDVEQ